MDIIVVVTTLVMVSVTETAGALVASAPDPAATSVTAAPVSVGGGELNEANTDEETAGTSVIGHTVVVTSITVVTSTVETPSGSEVGSAPVPERVGQLVTVGAHEMRVSTEVADIVSVVKPVPAAAVVVFANGGRPVEPADALLVAVPSFTATPVPVANWIAYVAGDLEIARYLGI